MATHVLNRCVQTLRRSAAATQLGGRPDPDLLAQFLEDRDPAAFEALVRRHGPLVLAACRKILNDPADVDDAFQATFLVLLRHAHSIRQRGSVGSWLYGVAHRVAVQARVRAERRRRMEQRATSEAADGPDLSWREACAVLHEELDRLPEKLRLPLLLCYLDERTRDEAAQQLGWTAGMVKGRLERGRKMLHRRLARRGVTLSAGLLAAIGGSRAAGGPPPRLVQAVLEAIAGRPSAAAAALARGAFPMFGKVRSLVAAALVTAGLVAGAVPLLASRERERPESGDPPVAQATGTAEKPGEIVLQGRVLGPDGQPAAGAKLYLATSPRWDAPLSRPVAEAGADGRFRLTAEPVVGQPDFRQLVATAPGHAPDWINLGKRPEGDITLRLPADDVPIRGRVVDLQGKPVANVAVTLAGVETTEENDLAPVFRRWQTEPYQAVQMASKRLHGPFPPGAATKVKTDADGRFELKGIGRGRLAALRLEGDGLEHVTVRVATLPNFDPKSAAAPPGFTAMPGMPRQGRPDLVGPEFTYSARPAQVVQGTVRDRKTGQPIAGIWVNGSVENGWWENYDRAQTDAAGRYRITGLGKGAQRRLTFFPGEDSPYLMAGKFVPDAEGLGPITVDAELTRGVLLKGRVTDKVTGKPVAGAGLHYTPLADNASFKSTPGTEIFRMASVGYSTDADGRFRLVVLPGAGLISAQVETRGDVIHSAYTQVMMDPADYPRAYQKKDEGLGQTFLAADGHIESLYSKSAYKIIDPAGGSEAISLELQFDPGKTVTGRVVGPDGQPLAGASVGGLSATFDHPTVLKGETFTAVALDPEQPRTLGFLHRGRKLAGSVKLTGKESQMPVVKLEPCGTLTGRVVTADGKPVAGAEVSLHYVERNLTGLTVGPRRGMATTDADGRFRVEELIPGQRFRIGFQVRGKFLETKSLRDAPLTVAAGSVKDLGDVKSAPYGE